MMSPCVDARNPGVARCVILALACVVMVCLSQALAGHDVSMDADILLTPWWGMRLSVGEEAEVDCGVLTGGGADTVTIEWVDSGGKTIATNSSMRSVEHGVDVINGHSIKAKVVSIGKRGVILMLGSNLVLYCLSCWAEMMTDEIPSNVSCLLISAKFIIVRCRRAIVNTAPCVSRVVILPEVVKSIFYGQQHTCEVSY